MAVTASGSSAKLVAANITQTFGGVRALDDVTFWVPEGGAVGLIGQNGSGKTTLLNVLTGQLRPQSGSIAFNGREMLGSPPEYFARAGIGRVFQSVQVFPRLTVLENLLISRLGAHESSGHAPASEREMLERVGLLAYAPLWARDLSYGHQRLLEIAMALAAGSELILLDEPTAGLSPSMVRQVIAVLKDVNAVGTALVLIEHETEVVFSVCDTVWVMNEGRVMARGLPEEIRTDPQVLALYLGEPVAC